MFGFFGETAFYEIFWIFFLNLWRFFREFESQILFQVCWGFFFYRNKRWISWNPPGPSPAWAAKSPGWNSGTAPSRKLGKKTQKKQGKKKSYEKKKIQNSNHQNPRIKDPNSQN